MSQNKLYVGNLPYSVNENDIRDIFQEFGGIVEVKLITDRETGNSKGFAFVTMDSQQAAESSLALNGKEFNGRNIKVNVARENDSRGGSRGGDRGDRGDRGGRW